MQNAQLTRKSILRPQNSRPSMHSFIEIAEGYKSIYLFYDSALLYRVVH